MRLNNNQSLKKGVGGMKKTSGGGVSQNVHLKAFEETMEVTAKKAAEQDPVESLRHD